tara:strand:- start:2551 stop:2790 length:240 start_codon:yes stop_codon:yes gene_type:complete
METSKKDVQYLDSGVSVKKAQWDDKRKKVKRHTLEEKLNASLQSLLISVQKMYYNSKEPPLKTVTLVFRLDPKGHNTHF